MSERYHAFTRAAAMSYEEPIPQETNQTLGTIGQQIFEHENAKNLRMHYRALDSLLKGGESEVGVGLRGEFI